MTDPDAGGSPSNEDGGTGRRTKVQRVLDERDFEELGFELERRWTAESGERLSLRELADFFNRRVLEDELEATTMQPLDSELDTIYAALTDDSVDSETQVTIRRRLEREGLDPEALSNDFVTHQAIHTYLTKSREVSSPSTGTGPDADRSLERINRLQSRVTSVVTTTLESLRDAGVLTLGEFTPYVNITIGCNDCGGQYNINELFEAGGCDCTDSQ